MNKEQLVQEVAKTAKVSQKEAGEVLNAIISVIETSVSKGDKVTLLGFGTFESRKRAARTGRNLDFSAEIKISAKKVPFGVGICADLPSLRLPVGQRRSATTWATTKAAGRNGTPAC